MKSWAVFLKEEISTGSSIIEPGNLTGKVRILIRLPRPEKLLKLREGQVVENRFPGLRVEKVRYEELAEDFLNDYRVNGKKSIERAEMSLKRLETYFKGMRAIDITTDRIKAYILQRQEEGAENGTLDRELSALEKDVQAGQSNDSSPR